MTRIGDRDRSGRGRVAPLDLDDVTDTCNGAPEHVERRTHVANAAWCKYTHALRWHHFAAAMGTSSGDLTSES
jgi:hypothetical protein